MPSTRASRKAFDLVVFGEFFSDLIFYRLPDKPRLGEEIKTEYFLVAPGGGLSTTGLAANRLGTRTGIITRIGSDAKTLPTWSQLVDSGLDVSACEVKRDLPTALSVCVAYHGDRMMITHEPINWNLEDMLQKPAVQKKLERSRHVHLACALRQPERWIPVLTRLRDQGITISADFGWNPDVSPKELMPILKYCDFIFPNEHEARAVTGTNSATRAIEKLAEWVRYPIVKLGAKGSMLLAEGKLHRQAAMELTVVDATGAGDAFNGGFLHGFLQGWDWSTCLKAGNVCGSLAASVPGGSRGLPSPQRLSDAMLEFNSPRRGKSLKRTRQAAVSA